MKEALPVVAAPAALVALAPYAVPALLVVGAGLALGAVLADIFGSDKKPSAKPAPDAVPDTDSPSVEPRPDSTRLLLGGSPPPSVRPSALPACPSAVRSSCRSRRATREDLEAVFSAGPLSRADAASALRQRIGCGCTAAYRTLSPDSALSVHLHEEECGRLSVVRTNV